MPSIPCRQLTDIEYKNAQASAVLAEIKACKDKIAEITENQKIKGEDDILRVQYFVHTLQIFQTEFFTYLREWDAISLLVEVKLLRLCPTIGHGNFRIGNSQFGCIGTWHIRSHR